MPTTDKSIDYSILSTSYIYQLTKYVSNPQGSPPEIPGGYSLVIPQTLVNNEVVPYLFKGVTGFQATMLKNTETGQIVVVSAGTDPTDIRDIITDASLVLQINPQLIDAQNYYNTAVKPYLDQHNISTSSVDWASHSLATDAGSKMALETGGSAYNFSPLGNDEISEQAYFGKIDVSNIHNFVNDGDILPQLNNIYGDVTYYDAPQNNGNGIPGIIENAYVSHLWTGGYVKDNEDVNRNANAGNNSNNQNNGSLNDHNAYPDLLPFNPGNFGFPNSPGNLLFPGLANPFKLAGQNPLQTDPLLISLDGNPIQTTSVSNGQHFNFDGSGFAQQMAWVAPQDGILVRDINGTGLIDNGSELFGNQTVLSNGQKAANGFAALADLDTNHDGIINSSDANFSQLKVMDGYGTLKTLNDLGIQSISLSNVAINSVDSNGNTEVSGSHFTKTDGTTGIIADYNLQANKMNSISLSNVSVSSNILNLPNLQGFGNVNSLQQAMQIDSTGTLESLVQSFISESDPIQQSATMDQILATWTGQTNIASNYHVSLEDGKQYINPAHIAILEKFMGQNYTNAGGDSSVYVVPASILSQAYYRIKNFYSSDLMLQTQLNNYFNDIQVTQNSTTYKYDYNLNKVVSDLQQLASTNPEQAKHDAAAFSSALKGVGLVGFTNYTDFYTSISGLGADYKTALDQAGYTVVSATAANQTIGYSYWQREPQDAPATWLVGGQGNDDLQGGYNNDVLQGGPGDTLEGGYGNDTYLYSTGGGHEQIIEGGNYYSINNASGGNDTIKFGPGITQANISNANLIRTNKIIQMYYSLNSFRKAA